MLKSIISINIYSLTSLQINFGVNNLIMLNPSIPETLSNLKYIQPKTLAGKFIEQVQQVESEGIRKFVMEPLSISDSVTNDASAIMQMMGASTSTTESSLPPEAMALMQQMMSNQKVAENLNAGSNLIRKRPDYIEKAIKDAESRDRFLIDIENYCILDLSVGKSTKSAVINTLKTISKINYEKNIQESIFYYTDIGLSFYFDENDIINEIEIDEKYKKSTTKGLKINDSLERAIELYGNPRMKSAKGAIWSNFSILMRDRSDEIKLIRLKIRE